MVYEENTETELSNAVHKLGVVDDNSPIITHSFCFQLEL